MAASSTASARTWREAKPACALGSKRFSEQESNLLCKTSSAVLFYNSCSPLSRQPCLHKSPTSFQRQNPFVYPLVWTARGENTPLALVPPHSRFLRKIRLEPSSSWSNRIKR